VYWAFFKNMPFGDTSLACVAYRGLVFTDKRGVCKKDVVDSNASDSNILKSAEVRGEYTSIPLFNRTFNVL